MPTIQVDKQEIEALLTMHYSIDAFTRLLFDFGLEIDEVLENDHGITYKIEIPANRYDLLCAEGLCNALKSYLYNEQYKDYNLGECEEYEIINEELGHRKYVASAVIKNCNFDKKSFSRFIEYQEKLADSLGKNRSIVAIGTHDLDVIQWPVVYKSIPKSSLSFVPLNHTEEVTDLCEYFKGNKKMTKYLEYTECDKYTVFMDNSGKILSVPPVINSDHSKISVATKNMFVEVTGTNQHKANVCLSLLLSAFRTDEMYSVADKELHSPKTYEISTQEVQKELNITLNVHELQVYLTRMMYKATHICSGNIDATKESINITNTTADGTKANKERSRTLCKCTTVTITLPRVRQDVLHKCDIIEDIAVSYGYNNMTRSIPNTSTIGKENRLNKFSDKIRNEMAMCCVTEVVTMVLTSKNEDLRKEVLVSNYKSTECEVVRSSLLPGLLKTIGSNLHCKIPIRIFEVGDVVYLNDKSDVGASNRRKLACMIVGHTSHLDDIQGVLTMILEKCGIKGYTFVRQNDDTIYTRDQSAVLKINDVVYGNLGVCSGDLLNKYKIPYSGSMFELDIERILDTLY